ncbi:MAG: PDZ domain-containing protein, partial [Armatimonadota bacterium]
AGFSIFFDIVVVTMGTVAVLMKSNSNLIAAVSVGAGAMPTPSGRTGMVLRQFDPISAVTIGPADVLFVALFLSAIYQMNLSRRQTFLWMFGLLGIALLIVQTTSLPIPALAPMGIAVLVANLRHAAFTSQEKRDLGIGAAFAVFCATLMVIGARTFLVPPPSPSPPSLGLKLGRAQGPQGQTGPPVITEIKSQSRAETAGLKPGDAILAVNGSPATDEQFAAAIAELRERGGMTLTIQRRGETKPRLIEVKVPKGN